MLNEQPLEILFNQLTAKHEVAMLVLKQVANMRRKTREQRMANACVNFLESVK